MQDAQEDRSQICLNYVTKGPNVIANINRKFYCCVLYIVCTIYMFFVQLCLSHPGLQLDTLSPPKTHSGSRFTLLHILTLVCTMRHRLKPSCQNINNNLTGSSEFTLKSLLPVNWQQPFHRKIAAAS